MSLYQELKRRNVIRVATAYVVAAWLVIQVIETIFPAFGFTDRAVRIAVIVLGIGFVPAVIAAWVFEWTPEGLKRDEDARGGEGSFGARILDRAIVVALLLGISYFAFDKFVLAPERAAEREAEVAEQAKSEALTGFYGDRSIAVLPFDNLSSDPEQVYFVDGVTEEVLNLLARVRDLRVISRSSSFAFRGQGLEIPDIAERLNVGHVLEGSVRRSGNHVRVTAQLIEARTDTHLWSKTYDKELDDVFLIQDEIAADVAKNLEIKLLQPLPHSRNVNPKAYELVQQVKQIFQVRDKNTAARMYALARRALELDPDYPEAVKWMGLAEYMRAVEGLITWEEAEAKYVRLDARYAELAPDSGYLEAGRAFELEKAGDLEQAAGLYLQSLEKELTDSEQLRWAGRFALLIEKNNVAVRILEHGAAIDPLNYQIRRVLSQALMHRGEPGDYRRAIEAREQFLAVATGGQPYYSLLLILTGQAQKVADVWAPVYTESHYQALTYLAMADHALGRADDVQAKLARIEDMLTRALNAGASNGDVWSLRFAIASVAAWVGDFDKAFAQLAERPERIPYGERLDFSGPVWRDIRDDPRWEEFRAAIGMSAERLDAIEFDPWLPE
jgi:adenylate cyclase